MQTTAKRNWPKEIIKMFIGLALLIAVFFGFFYLRDHQPETVPYKQYILRKEKVTYLIFISDKSIAVVNYTQDSMSAQPYSFLWPEKNNTREWPVLDLTK